jgi:hypothetical protein
MVILDIILLLSLAWCGREDRVGSGRTYHMLQAGLFGEPCWRVVRNKSLVGERKFVSFGVRKEEMQALGGDGARPQIRRARLRPFFDLTRWKVG